MLFPLLAVAFTYGAFLHFAPKQPAAVLRIALPILISLAGIRFFARVLTVVFPNSGFARLMERMFSWLAWIAAVLWILGLAPEVMDDMESIYVLFGKTKVSLLAIVQGVLSSGVVMVIALWISATIERKVLSEACGTLIASSSMHCPDERVDVAVPGGCLSLCTRQVRVALSRR